MEREGGTEVTSGCSIQYFAERTTTHKEVQLNHYCHWYTVYYIYIISILLLIGKKRKKENKQTNMYDNMECNKAVSVCVQ